MRSTLLLVCVALNAWTATGFPIHRPIDDQLAAQGITLKYRSSPAGVMENPPQFSDWSQEERNQLRTSILEAGGKGAAIPPSWAERTQRTFNAWRAFYLTQYPAKLEASQQHKSKRPSYFTAIDTSQKTNKTDPETSNTSDEQQSEKLETGASGLAGLYLSHFAHMDPATICSRFSPEIVGLCIFLLVPAAVMIVEVVDMLHDRWTPEQFPERGRGRERLTGVERQYMILAKYEREKAAMDQSQTWWGQRRRSK
ncbi:hypothetical protein PISL3812_00172 [Talaromyces islandicus]|uniref:Uncharacterized protein n=1 Tax=Talaromyces islandicus TaxID=28573 RepID=A0A0U1LK90_TALIS|nr:hypothetical protein PISL3812_00172 [Talaromyces islandicus]